jgi:hypothetical protein
MKILFFLLLFCSTSYASDSTSYWRKQYYDLLMEHEDLELKYKLLEIKPEIKKKTILLQYF